MDSISSQFDDSELSVSLIVMKPRLLLCILSFLTSYHFAFAKLNQGETAPDFNVKSIKGADVKLSDYKGKIVVLEWFNIGCPFVLKHYKPHTMQSLQSEYTGKGVIWLTINSTQPKHENFLTPEKAAQTVENFKIKSTEMLMDPDGKVGKLYDAKATPHMFIIDANGKLVYQGAIDDTPSPSSDPAKAHNYVKTALDELLAGKKVTTSETKQYGCGIKYAD
jgi:peroxiredoxin